MEKTGNNKTYNISYEWGNPLDNCLPDEKLYHFGSFTDLCGMTIKDAMRTNGGDLYLNINCCNNGITNSGNVSCNCGGGGNSGGSNTGDTGQNVITITNKESNGLYEIVIEASQAPKEDVDVLFTVDSAMCLFTLKAGETSLNTGIISNSPYADVKDVEFSTIDKSYKYSIVNNVVSGKFKLIYLIDNTIHKIEEYKHNDIVKPIDAPNKEGYTFNGWDGMVDTMPDKDVKVYGSYTINSYTISYIIDGVEVFSEKYTYGSEIVPYVPGDKEGFTFSGWDTEIPSTMPANDVVLSGTYVEVEKPKYSVTFYNEDGSVLDRKDYTEGETITVPEGPEKDGYRFMGWNPEVPEVMGTENLEFAPMYEKLYTVEFYADGVLLSS